MEPNTNNEAQSPAHYPENNREWKLIEKLLMRMQEQDRKDRRWKIFFRILTFAYLFLLLYLFLSPSGCQNKGHGFGAEDFSGENYSAVVKVQGQIMSDSAASAGFINEGLREAFESEAKAILLDINSPGGSPVHAGYVYDEIIRLKAEYPEKPVYAVVSDLGASAAYYIAAAADKIFVNKASIIGSIGVIMQSFNAEELMDSIGLQPRTLTSGDNKDILSPFKELSEPQRVHVQNMLDEVHQQFIDAVKAGRGERLSKDPAIFSGLFWTGESAIELGIADDFGSLSSVNRDIVGAESLRNFSYSKDPIEEILRKYGASMSAGLIDELKAQQNNFGWQ